MPPRYVDIQKVQAPLILLMVDMPLTSEDKTVRLLELPNKRWSCESKSAAKR